MHCACVHNVSFLAVKWQRCAREREQGLRKMLPKGGSVFCIQCSLLRNMLCICNSWRKSGDTPDGGRRAVASEEIDISSCLGDYTANSKPTMCRAPRAQHTGDRHDLIPHTGLSVCVMMQGRCTRTSFSRVTSPAPSNIWLVAWKRATVTTQTLLWKVERFSD